MKIKKVLRIFSLLITSCLLVSQLDAFAATKNNQSSYFDEETCLSYGQSFINSIINSGAKTSWSVDTKPSEIIKTYDVDGNANAYIVNLKANGTPNGYLLIEAFTSGTPNIIEFGYSGSYYLSNPKYFSNLKNEKIIYTGNRGFYINSNGQYYAADDNSITISDKKILQSEYNRKVKAKNNAIANNRSGDSYINNSYNTATINSVSSSTTEKNVYNLSSFVPYTMEYFEKNVPSSYHLSFDGVCAPTCGMNMLRYWQDCRGISKLFVNSNAITSFVSLYKNMKTASDGTYDNNAYNGMNSYISSNNLKSALGSDYKTQSGFSWSWIKTQIQNNNVIAINADAHSYQWYLEKKKHSFLGVGYLSNSDGEYIRVCDEWSESTDHYYQYLYSNVDTIWYYRWA